MTAPAHPQRCETCDFCDLNTPQDFDKSGKLLFCSIIQTGIKRNQRWIHEKVGCASHSSVQSRDQVLDEVIKVIRKKVSLPTNSGEQISCDASIRLGIIHDINKELRTPGSRDP